MGGFDVTQDAAGADRGELLVIADQPDAAPGIEDVADHLEQAQRVGHARLIDQHERALIDAGQVRVGGALVEVPAQLGQCVGGRTGLVAQLLGRRRRRGQTGVSDGLCGRGP